MQFLTQRFIGIRQLQTIVHNKFINRSCELNRNPQNIGTDMLEGISQSWGDLVRVDKEHMQFYTGNFRNF